MAKRMDGTTPESGTVGILFQGNTTQVNITRDAQGNYDVALPTALDVSMANGGSAEVSFGDQSVTVSVPVAPQEGSTIGIVGQEPPIYSGTAALPAIPSPNGLIQDHYGNGQVEFQWIAPTTFNSNNGDLYELTLDGIIIYRNTGNSFLVNDIGLTSHNATVRVVRNDGSFGPATSIDFVTS